MGLRKVTPDELAKILERHELWIDTDGKEGERANLQGTDLEGCSLDYLAARNAMHDFFGSFEAELSRLERIVLEKAREEDAGE